MSATTLLSGPSNILGGDASKAFAILIPKSPSAELAFDEVVSTVMQAPDDYARVMKSIHAHPPTDSARSQFSMQDDLAEVVQDTPPPLWTGAYKFELKALSSRKTSWLLGFGPSSAAKAPNHPVDLLLAPKTNVWCQKSLNSHHARIFFSEESLSLMIEANYNVAISGPLGYRDLHEPSVVLHGTTIQFGDCIYKMEFTDYAESLEFEDHLMTLMGSITQNGPRLYEHMTVPSSRHGKMINIRLLEYSEYFDSPMPGLYAFYQPLVNHSLTDRMKESEEATPGLTPDAHLYLLRDWLKGLNHLHTEKALMHRDINPNNLGIVESNPPRGVILDLDSATSATFSYDFALGTLPFTAPEIIDIKLWQENATPERQASFHRELMCYDAAVDVWSLGTSIWAMMKNCFIRWCAYDSSEERRLAHAQRSITHYVTRSRYIVLRGMLARTRQNISRDGGDPHELTLLHLCEQMLQWKSEDRPSAANLLGQVEAYLRSQ
ncbi:MAG: hypothetical protein LQ348_003444 [Seirophora lacunosa]|nr:MAG: hypothetical protein LQ348_003444 [Seirophora lacunosa]